MDIGAALWQITMSLSMKRPLTYWWQLLSCNMEMLWCSLSWIDVYVPTTRWVRIWRLLPLFVALIGEPVNDRSWAFIVEVLLDRTTWDNVDGVRRGRYNGFFSRRAAVRKAGAPYAQVRIAVDHYLIFRRVHLAIWTVDLRFVNFYYLFLDTMRGTVLIARWNRIKIPYNELTISANQPFISLL